MKFYNKETLIGRGDLPSMGTPCVYLIKNACGEFIYAGQSTNIKNRLRGHSRRMRDFDSYHYRVVDKVSLNNEEARLIINYKPSGNKILPSNDFYKTKAETKNDLIKMISVFIGDIDNDFYVKTKQKHQTKYIRTYKNMIIKNAVEECLNQLSKTLKE